MIDLIRKYVDNRIKLVKMDLVNVLANLSAGLVSSFMILLLVTFIILMLSISFAFWMASFFDDSNTIGFLIVGGVYILLFIIYMVFSKDSIDTKVKDQIVKLAFKSEDDLNDDEYIDFDDED
jgi:uncharacterized membrane protein (DUF485 family)